MTTCTARTRSTISPFERDLPDIVCLREVDETGRHIGHHQGLHAKPGWTALVTFHDNGFAMSQKYAPDEPNTNCMCRNPNARIAHVPSDHHWTTCSHCEVIIDSTRRSAVLCDNCAFWLGRFSNWRKVYPDGARFVRAHDDTLAGKPTAYSWVPGRGGAFGGRKFKVTFDDGTVVGPADFLWHNGDIPWWFDELLPPNAVIEAVAEYERRPGHTTGFNGMGSPLSYNAHPQVP